MMGQIREATMRATTLVLILFMTLAPAGIRAGDEISIDQLNTGTWWYGPQVSTKDLAGKVVLVELWGS